MKYSYVISAKLLQILILIVLVGFCPGALAADDLDSSRTRLDKLQKQIEKTMKELRSRQSEGGSLSEEIEKLNNEVRRIARLKKKSDQQLAMVTEKLNETKKMVEQLEGKLEKTDERIRKRLVVLYKTGEVGLIRALLSESESPRDIAQKYTFLSRMVKRDRELLNEYRKQSLEHTESLAELEQLHEKQSRLVLQRGRY